MIVAQMTNIVDQCPQCGHPEVFLVDLVDTKTGRVYDIVCEDCVGDVR